MKNLIFILFIFSTQIALSLQLKTSMKTQTTMNIEPNGEKILGIDFAEEPFICLPSYWEKPGAIESHYSRSVFLFTINPKSKWWSGLAIKWRDYAAGVNR